MKKQPRTYIFYIGIAVFAIGLLLMFILPDAEGAMQSLPFVLTGVGAGFIGVGVSNMLRKRVIEHDPKKAKEYEIAEKDERNIRLNEKAGLTTWYITVFVLAALSLIFVVFNNWVACWLTLGALFIHIASLFICIYFYNKRT